MADEASTEGKTLISNWLFARDRVTRLKGELNRADVDLLNAERALAKWMLPSDAKPGEKIAVWQGDSLFQVEVGNTEPPGYHIVTIRARGKHFSDLQR